VVGNTVLAHSNGETNNVITTRFTELVGCTIPIQQAGMGAVAPPELAGAVSEAVAL
jgi:NAD(P)H-dependent flavin oxidoreductase YrpB (nitropropane dioxygenase family)